MKRAVAPAGRGLGWTGLGWVQGVQQKLGSDLCCGLPIFQAERAPASAPALALALTLPPPPAPPPSGPVHQALPFFAHLGYACPERKDPGSFLQVNSSCSATPPFPSSLFLRWDLGAVKLWRGPRYD